MLKFAPANGKLKKLYKSAALAKWLDRKIGKKKAKVYSLSILAGVDCPFANDCKSQAHVGADGKRTIKDGPNTKFRCFSASQETQYDHVYDSRKHNHDILHDCTNRWDMADAIESAIPDDAGVIRIHVSGDFFNYEYFMAWLIVASRRPDILFYAYTKSMPYYTRSREYMPANLRITASRGGKRDDMIDSFNLKEAVVVYSEAEAIEKGLIIDDDDSHAADPSVDYSFALLIHGTQPPKSEASKALQILKKKGMIDDAKKVATI